MEIAVKKLTSKEERGYRDWAREHYQRHTPIDPLWHQAVKNECAKINCEQPLKVRRVMAPSPEIAKMFKVECGCELIFLKPEPIDVVSRYLVKPMWLRCDMHKYMSPRDMVLQSIVEE